MLLIDGGIWANNPTGLAVVEALTLLNIPRTEIEVLSLGCTHEISDLRTGVLANSNGHDVLSIVLCSGSHSGRWEPRQCS